MIEYGNQTPIPNNTIDEYYFFTSDDIVAVDPAVFGEHVVPPCGGTPLHDNKDDKYIGIPIQESVS